MIKVYICKFDDGAALPANGPELLPRWRRRRYERLRYAPARTESLAAGLLWRYVMEEQGLTPDEPVKFLQAGKPVFTERDNMFFSLSHSGQYAMVAVSDRQVGADVQKVKPVHLSIARRLNFRERDWLAAWPAPEQTKAFFRIWVRKEAWVKAVSEDRLLAIDQEDVMHDLPGWHFTDYDLADGYLAAVCCRDRGSAVMIAVDPGALGKSPAAPPSETQ